MKILKEDWIFVSLLAIVGLLFWIAVDGIVHAAEYKQSCIPPTTRGGGTSPFDPTTELKEYRWYVDGVLNGSSIVCEYTFNLPDGTYTITASTVDTNDREGPQAPGKSISLVTAPPDPPILQ